MSTKNLIAGVALAVVVAASLVSVADARRGRKCPPGYEDIGGKCVPDPTPGATAPFSFSL